MSDRIAALAGLAFVLVLSGCLFLPENELSGRASWWGEEEHAKPSASGETMDMNAMTAAHRTLPFNTMVRVTNLDNGRSVVVRIMDRGPFVRGRIIDVSRAAAERLGMLDSGVVPCRVEILRGPPSAR